MTALKVTGVLLTAFFFGLTFEGIGRKITARVQRRYGPPWYQNFIDVFKTLSKHGYTHGWIFDFGVIMALGGIIASLGFVPVGGIVASRYRQFLRHSLSAYDRFAWYGDGYGWYR